MAKVLGIEEEPAQVILFALNSTAGKIEIIRAVAARTASKQTRTALNAALDKVSSLAKRRNVYIHHMMGVDERGRVCRWDYRETPDTQARRIIVKEKDIVALVVEIKVVHNDLMFAAFPEMGPPPPLRETPLLQHASPKRAVDRSGRISGKGR
ncbi:MAG: hypothetical protein Q8L66_04830 [Caulobacter sp.]|nr:hypothetical protein [Caulobacter sp.]